MMIKIGLKKKFAGRLATLLAGMLSVTVCSAALADGASGPYAGFGTGVIINTDNGSSYRGVPFWLAAGYGAMIDSGVYLAGELSGVVATGSIDNYGDIKSTYSYQISLLPGIYLSEHTMGFIRAGAVRTRFSTLSAMKSGVVLGAGMQAGLIRNWDLRAEYDYTRYSSFRSDAFGLGLIYHFT